MASIIYDVAVSIDGYIAGPNGDISAFADSGAVVEDYRNRLSTYSCAIMGRATYEFGYEFGMSPGENPYPDMDCFVFSRTIEIPANSDVRAVRESSEEIVASLKAKYKDPIYLCGGGRFAAALLTSGLIDILRLKRAPAILGGGVPLFETAQKGLQMTCTDTKLYDDGYLFQEFALLQDVV